MEKRHRFSAWYILIGIWIVLIVQNIIFSMTQTQVIPYSEFLRLLKEDRITEVSVRSNQIQGKMKSQDHSGGDVLFRTIKVDPEISDLLDEHGVKFRGEIESTFLRNLFSWLFPIMMWIGIWYLVMKRMSGQQPGFMTLGRNRAKIYMEDEVNVTFEDVAGVDEAKQELVEITDFLESPERFTQLGGKIPRGILLVGPPGTGKTLLARAVAGESRVPFFSMSGSEFVEMFVGLGASRVRDLFVQAKEKAPCIIFIDELDALGKVRGFGGPVGGHDEREQTLNQLLVEMDGFDPSVGVILMAATNRPEILDPALLRPGRFDRHVLVDRPDKAGRKAILKVHLKNITCEENLDTDVIAGMTPGMVGADLANIVNEAALLAVRKNRDRVTMQEFGEAVERVVAGLEKKNRLINPEERRIVAHHEMGHAVIARALPGTDPVRKISIIPRGIAALGYTMQVPTEDRFLMKKSELLNKICTLLGGRAAEEIVFSDISTGAHNDLARSTDIARSMVREYGMSSKVGQVCFAREKQGQFLDLMQGRAQEYSEATARLIDAEVREIIDGQYRRALKILTGNRPVLDSGAVLLLDKEKIEGAELEALMDRVTSAG
ncbi:cell division protein FtsH [Desulfonema ishimotonii]|uniref:ATP-dependent zinc metalloprotease FtsH n=1 Tax=Desulfonema ishimotonii TaxID=45657 RepID=A0A401G0L7_9BACT|nr:ATP-dependent zinc metalloprotease FtsH [Desulfonema ishimotonii]GBC62736.1 cell division protein FtsH [Desulfonema ishimotonii]